MNKYSTNKYWTKKEAFDAGGWVRDLTGAVPVVGDTAMIAVSIKNVVELLWGWKKVKDHIGNFQNPKAASEAVANVIIQIGDLTASILGILPDQVVSLPLARGISMAATYTAENPQSLQQFLGKLEEVIPKIPDTVWTVIKFTGAGGYLMRIVMDCIKLQSMIDKSQQQVSSQ